MQAEKPIGYWIKQADGRLTRGIDQIQASFNMTRTQWQILNTLHEHACMQKSDLVKNMVPFADAQAVEEMLSVWQQESIVAVKEENGITLTEKGKLLHEQCSEQQKLFRQKAMEGITAEDYRITVLTLQKIAANTG